VSEGKNPGITADEIPTCRKYSKDQGNDQDIEDVSVPNEDGKYSQKDCSHEEAAIAPQPKHLQEIT